MSTARHTLDSFTQAYIEAALWSSVDDEGESIDSYMGIEDISENALAKMAADCADFQEKHGVPEYGDDRYTDEEKAGHDFWLTRNHHGTGFWDRTEFLDNETAKKYTDAAHSFPECSLYVNKFTDENGDTPWTVEIE